MVNNKALIGAAGLLAVGAWMLYQRQQDSADQDTADGGPWIDTTPNTADPFSSFFDWLDGGETSGFINTSDTGESNALQDTMNTIRNWIGGNEITRVVEAGPGYLIVERPNGAIQKLQGTRNWRNNNPGNLEYGNYSISMGAIGTDGRFAVFPNYAAGRTAKEKLIFEGNGYKGLTLMQMITRYAPPSENNTTWYQSMVMAAVGGINKLMGQYSPTERNRILAAMEKVEGFKPGTVIDIPTA